MTADLCIEGGYNDLDSDGIGDFCEEQIAFAFRPELAYWHGDNVGGEPYWSAKIVAGDTIRVAYLLAYYMDDGVEHFACLNWPDLCAGHYGDSEWITVEVSYDAAASSRHWVTRRIQLSQHQGYSQYGPGPKGFPYGFTYPSATGAYFRSFVAVSKHANYRTQSECDAGGFLGFDHCSSDTFLRIRAGPAQNLGNRETPLRNCVYSSNPFYPGVSECFWTGQRFGGWQGAIPDATGYGYRLFDMGF